MQTQKPDTLATASGGSVALPPSLQHTKILCTLGPATATPDKIREMLLAGADAIRLNFSHSTHETHRKLFEMVREVSAELGRHVPIVQDLQGPKIRVGSLPDGPVLLRPSETVVLTTATTKRGDGRIPVGYKKLAREVSRGDVILLDDGLIALRVEETNGRDIACFVVNGGLLKEKKGINLPGVVISEPSLTAKDRRDLLFGLSLGVDYVALSFVRSARDIIDLKKVIASQNKRTPVISKIEKVEAIRELDAIVAASDAVMIARGDLGVELPGYEVPLLQKRIIKKCNDTGTPVITATQMLESMVNNPRPTRAESSDVANAVFDGTDGVMLSAETSVGAFPVEAVMTMNDILRATESSVRYEPAIRMSHEFASEAERSNYAIATAAAMLSAQVDVRAILVLTYSGDTARVMSRSRPDVPIIAMAEDEVICRQLGLYRNIYSVTIEHPITTEEAVPLMKQAALDAGVVEKGDTVIITAGFPLVDKARTNMVVVNRI